VFFGDAEFTPYASGWTIVRSDADLITFATSILTDGRVIYGNTGIGSGIEAGLDLLDRAVFDAERKVIDVSGDGRETSVPLRRRINPSLAMARNRAKQSSVTINGLAILQEDHQLRDYFDKSVKIGADSFVMSVDYFEDITEAMTRKLIREIQPRGIVAEGASGDPVRRSSFLGCI
jgi:hypothetical protein